MEKHFTATAFVIEKGKILLIHHNKLNTWLPPGGHVDPNETPAEAACRETKEETGLDIEILKQESVWIESKEANSFPKPYLCLLEDIPSHKNVPAHQHMDFIYIARLLSNKDQKMNQEEIKGFYWFTKEEIEKFEENKDIFPNVKKILLHIFLDRVVEK